MDKHGRTNNLTPFSGLQSTSIMPFRDNHHFNLQPCVSYQDRSSSTSYVSTVAPRMGKRKHNIPAESMFHPLTKQQITEARISASMQMLTLENSALHREDNLSKRFDDEGFEDDANMENDSVSHPSDKNTKLPGPQFKFSDSMLEGLNNIRSEILPEQIYKTLNQRCLALIPYVPQTTLLSVPAVADTKNKEILSIEKTKDKESVVDEGMVF